MKKKALLSVAAVSVFLALGTILRLWYYLDARSLFMDEANLALNISELNYRHFFQPLLYDQYAPPLFLVFSKWVTLGLGNHEWALRFLPFAGGILSLFAFYAIVRKLNLAPAVRWFPLAMLSLSPFLLRFSTEFKQYSTDAALALSLLWLALYFPPEKTKARGFWLWAISGALSLWLSMPAAFVLAGLGTYYGYGFLKRNGRQAMTALALAGLAWLFSFFALYFLVLKAGTERPALLHYHAAYFFPVQFWEAEAWKTLGNILYGLLSPVLGFTVVGLATGTGLLLWGSYRMSRQHTGVFLLITIPILSCFAASSLQLFSLIPRVALFLMPLFLLLTAYGASEVWKTGTSYVRIALLALLLLEAAPFFNSLYLLGRPTEIENLKGALQQAKASAPTAPAYIEFEAIPAYRYYSSYHIDTSQHRLPGAVTLNWDQSLDEVMEWRQQKPGFWLVFSHLMSDFTRKKMERMRAMARKVAPEQLYFKDAGVAVYWYGAAERIDK